MDETAGRYALLILGMHRSGTSAVAGQLAALGMRAARDLLPPQPDNPKGFFEPRAIVDLHDEILKVLGSTWDDPRPLPEGWVEFPEMAAWRAKLAAWVVAEFGGQAGWFVKDPRLCRLLPLWLVVLGELGINPKILLVVRSPAEVIASLAVRSRTDSDQAGMLWLAHYADAEIASRGLARELVLYEDWLRDWRSEAGRVAAGLGLELAAPQGGDGFVDAGLRHQSGLALPVFSAPQNALVATFYAALQAWRRGGVNPAEMADTVAAALAAAGRGAFPVLAYMREADARRHAAQMRDLQRGDAVPGQDIFTRHFLAEQERATAKAQALAHERLLLIKQMQASRSWRMTRPLRALMRLLRRPRL